MLNDLWSRLIAWTGTIVSPDWAALVALIPVLLLLVVVAFLVITAAKWANAGPTHRGPGQRQPLAPDGTPLRGPSVAPLVLAAGAFVLAFGLVAGGLWLPVGILVTSIGLAWWTLELRRDDRPQRTGRQTTGADAGDAARPATSAPSRVTPARIAIVGVVIVVIALVAATSRVVPDAPGASPGAVPPVPTGAYQATLPPADAALAAQNVNFVPTTLTAPAGRPFTVAFDNRDKVPHNLEIRDSAGKQLFLGDIVIGPEIVIYNLPSLPAGQYPFLCTVHPAMTGTLTVK